MKYNFFFSKYAYLNRFKEYNNYNINLYSITIFPYNNINIKPKVKKAILNFSFKEINFNKKKVLPFFFAAELLTNQKCIATLSSKNNLLWKLRKGMLVGCKLTLRKNNLNDFLETLSFALPRMEKFKPILKDVLKNKKKENSFSLTFKELLFFYQIEFGLGINSEVNKFDVNFIFSNYSLEEKFFLLTASKFVIEI